MHGFHSLHPYLTKLACHCTLGLYLALTSHCQQLPPKAPPALPGHCSSKGQPVANSETYCPLSHTRGIRKIQL
jgi:hypothetical protein